MFCFLNEIKIALCVCVQGECQNGRRRRRRGLYDYDYDDDQKAINFPHFLSVVFGCSNSFLTQYNNGYNNERKRNNNKGRPNKICAVESCRVEATCCSSGGGGHCSSSSGSNRVGNVKMVMGRASS
jgi:hypothetical protein